MKRYPRERGKNFIHYFGGGDYSRGATIQGNMISLEYALYVLAQIIFHDNFSIGMHLHTLLLHDFETTKIFLFAKTTETNASLLYSRYF